MDFLDQPSALDAHDALPLDRLVPWLATTLGHDATSVSIGRFGRGFSNLTFLVTVDGEELVVRRPPPGVTIAGAHDMLREASVVRAVRAAGGPAPEVVAVCDDPAVLGAGFYVMRRVPGVILRERLPPGLVFDPPTAARASEALVDAFVRLHNLPVSAFAGLGKPEGYIRRQVEGWTKRYQGAKTDELPAVDRLAERLLASLPDEVGPTLLHNDYKFDNVVLSPALDEVLAVLDWEMATVGDPRMDLGTLLAWWVQADDPAGLHALRLGPTNEPGSLTRGEIVARYAAGRGIDAPEMSWFYAFGMFKNAVVAQQLYARFVRGQTSEKRYARMLDAVKGLAAVATGALALQRIDKLA